MSTERICYLIRCYTDNIADDEEVEELFEWLRQHSEDGVLNKELEVMAANVAPDADYDPAYWEPVLVKLLTSRKSSVRKMNFHNWSRYVAAAVVIIILGISAIVLFTYRKSNGVKKEISKIDNGDALPGGNRAVLTLANGQTFLLDSLQGNLIQSGAQAVVNKQGKLKYEGEDSVVQYHTLSTPKGGQYKLVLPDGTNVWLNAASSITYPTSFAGKERNVSVKGEVYFEVTKNKLKPFRVNVDKMQVEVLGTKFNINSYADEDNIKTTLFEGSVDIKRGNDNVMLKPGEQAQVNTDGAAVSINQTLSPSVKGRRFGSIVIVAGADLEQVIAWKNGSFQFDKSSLSAVLRQLSRWYDVDVIYEKGIPNIYLGGEMKRDLTLSQVLKGLGKIGVNFKIEGKQLIVLP